MNISVYNFNEEILLKIFGASMFFDLVDVGIEAQHVIDAARLASKTRKIVRLGQFEGMHEKISSNPIDSLYFFSCKLNPEILDLMWRSKLEPSNVSWNYVLPVDTRNSIGNNMLSHEYIGKGRIEIIDHCSNEVLEFLNKLMALPIEIKINDVDRLILR